MKIAAAIILASLSTTMARASDFVGVYGLITKVVFEPNAGKPERVQIFGTFSIASPGDPNGYQAPQRGYLYFKANPNDTPDATRREWADLAAAAEKHMVVAFGQRYNQSAKVRKADEKPNAPDLYKTGVGLVKMRTDTEYAPIKALLAYD